MWRVLAVRVRRGASWRAGKQVNILVGKNGAEKAAKKVTEMLQHHQVPSWAGHCIPRSVVSHPARYLSLHGIPLGRVSHATRYVSWTRGGGGIPAAHHKRNASHASKYPTRRYNI